jgi:hypothetical protein
MKLNAAKSVIFRKADLSKCLFLETDVTRINFVDVTWGGAGWPARRKAVYDELRPSHDWQDWLELSKDYRKNCWKPLKYDYNLLAQLYRRLQQNYIDSYQYTEAGDFYIGEQEMRRKARGPILSILSVAFLYKIVSYYGERYFLPFWWLLATVFLFPLWLLFDGVKLAPEPGGIADTINYDWSWSFADLMIFRSDFWNCVGANLAACTFNRSGGTALITSWHQQLVLILEVILIITFVTFFILALRRRYKRKSF